MLVCFIENIIIYNMTTEELLWNAAFEQNEEYLNNSYNYNEEWAIERYYEDKELFERFGEFFKTAG